MTSKERAKLRSLGTQETALFQIGKNGIGDELVTGISQALDKRELVKVSVLKTSPLSARDCMDSCAEKLVAEGVAAVGNTFLLYRRSTIDGVKHIAL